MSARRSIAKDPPKPAAPTRPSKGLAPGVAVLVTGGAAKGASGNVVAPWPDYAPGVPSWVVELGDRLGHSTIREDFLERVPA